MADRPPFEVLKFIGSDEECTLLIKENITTIFSSEGSHNKGSSKLTLKNFVDFSWVQRYYRGQLIALHISEKLIAYGFSKPGTSEGLVRVVKRETDERILIKGFSGIIEDISFAHLYETIMLACIDQSGTVYVYVVKEDNMPNNLKVFPIFKIIGDPSFSYQNKHLLSWCQFIPEQVNNLKKLEYEPSYRGKILAVVRGSEVEIWHVGIASTFTAGPVCSNFELNKSNDSVTLSNIKSALFKIDLKDSDIIGVSFSADGSNIALALSNGSIYFYQFRFERDVESPKCVFTWQPEEVFMNLKSMAFLDNRKPVDGDVESWKYVVTFSNQSELILWSCETWKCLQKLKFNRCIITQNPMKLTVDETGKYIFLSDIDNNFLFVMEVSIDINSPKKHMKIVSVTEIMLQTPMLNLIIINAKIDHNEVNYGEQYNSGNNSNSLNKYSTIINLFAIQPKSIQEGQLIISSPEQSIKEQFLEKKIEPKNIFPKPPSLDILMDSVDISQDKTKVQEPNAQEQQNGNFVELTSFDVHNMVKARLRLKGIDLNQTSAQTPIQLLNRKIINYNSVQQTKIQQSTSPLIMLPNTYQNTYDMDKVRECSPSSNHEVQTIFKQPEPQLQYDYEVPETPLECFESTSNYSEKEGNISFTGESVFNGSGISVPRLSTDTSQNINKPDVNQLDEIYACLQDINSQIKWLTKNQNQIDNQTSSLPTNPSDLCQILEPILMGMVKKINEQSHRKLQIIIDQHQKKIADIVRNSSNSNKVDTELFTRSLVASLNPTLDAILKDLFMSTVIPKFEHACCSMFKQIDASFTERSLEYQNELKLLLNEEGNINYKLEYAFDKFKTDISSIIKHTEKKILSSQNDMQKQFSFLLKEKSCVESFVNDSENIANQYMMLNSFIEDGDYATAFEKALSASNLDLVVYVCEKIEPEELFLTQNALSLPIVLSLIQQLSHDLTNNTELKHKYLDAAVGSLTYSNDLHKDKINLILIKMDSNLEKFMQQCPYHVFSRKLKMLQLAVKTIISFNNHPGNN